MKTEPYQFEVNEYVWDRVRDGPAIVVGAEDAGRLTVAEIVLPARKLGRVAHRRPEEVCRYVHLLLPEDEAEAAEILVGGTAPLSPKGMVDQLARFTKRLKEARVARGIIRRLPPPPDAG